MPTYYTEVPNELFEAMTSMCESELKVTLALIRQTHGYHRDSCTMTYEKLHEKTNLVSRSTIAKGIKLMIKRERPFFKKTGRSTYSIVQKVYSSSTESVLSNKPKVQKVYSNSTESVLPTTSLKENSKERRTIYIHDESEQIREMMSAISGVVSTGYGPGINENEFSDAAYMLIGLDATIDDVAGFRDWWIENTYYAKSSPASLKTFVDTWKIYTMPPQERPLNGSSGSTSETYMQQRKREILEKQAVIDVN